MLHLKEFGRPVAGLAERDDPGVTDHLIKESEIVEAALGMKSFERMCVGGDILDDSLMLGRR